MSDITPSAVVRQASTWSLVWGVVLILLGMLAVGSPFLAAVAVNAVLAWLIVFAGVVHVIFAFHARGVGSVLWKLLVGVAYVAFGMYLLARPALGVASLTLVLASLFLIVGVLDIVEFFRARALKGSGWILLDGVVTLLLGLLIYAHWPSSSAWAVGTLVGVSMIIGGVTRVMVSLAVRRAARAISLASSPPSSSMAA